MTNEPQPATAETGTIDLMFYLRLFLRRRWVILAFLAVVVAAVAFYTLRQPKVFQASTSLIIDTSAPRVLDKQMGEVIDEGSGGYWYNKEYYQTQYKVIVSRAVAQRVVDKLGLQSDATFLGLEKVSDEATRAELMAKLDAPSLLQARISVLPAKDSRVVSIAVEDLDAGRAALLANEVADAYIAENLALKLRITESASRWLEERMTSLEDKSKTSELALYDFKKSADMLTTSLEDRQSMLSQRLNALNAALTEVKLKIAGLKARVDAIRAVQQAAKFAGTRWAEGLPSASASDNLLIQQFKVRLATQQSECAELKGRGYLDQHPKFISCQEKLSGAEQDLIRELNNIIVASETDLHEATGKDKNLTALFDAAKAEAFEVNKRQIEFDQLKRESDNNQRLYDMVLKRLKDIELSGLLRTSNVRVLDAARPELRPVRPNAPRAFGLAFVLGLLGGLGLALLLEQLDNTVTSQAEIEERLGIPFLGFVPTIPDEKEPSVGRRDLHIHTHPKSSVAECCRAIRTNLLFMTPDKPFKTLVISSAGPQEGKSSSVINIGIAMAQSGNRVLLIDTDMRRPRLHKAFGVPNDLGVSSLILDQGSIEVAIKSTDVPGLFVLPCGPIPPNPAELLHTDAFAGLLETLRGKFDRVILDSPPIGAVADAVVLSTRADGVLLVIKAAHTSRDMARRAVRSLRDVNAKLLGAVLNNINLDDPKYGDYYYYAYRQYGAYYGEKKDEAAPS